MITAHDVIAETHPYCDPESDYIRFGHQQQIEIDGDVHSVIQCTSNDGGTKWSPYTIVKFDDHNVRYRLVLLFGVVPDDYDNSVFIERRIGDRPFHEWQLYSYPDSVSTDIGLLKQFKTVEVGDEIRWNDKKQYVHVTDKQVSGQRISLRCEGSRGGVYRVHFNCNGAYSHVRRISGEGEHLGTVDSLVVRSCV